MNRIKRIRRILLVIDKLPDRLTIESVAELAVQLQAELLGLFVEDVNLLRCAQLPGVHELSRISGSERELDLQEIDKLLRVQAKKVQEQFSLLTAALDITASFKIARGHLAKEILILAEQVDMVIMGRGRLADYVSLSPGRLAMGQLAEQFTGPITMLQSVNWLQLPLAVVVNAQLSEYQALFSAINLLTTHGQLLVLILAESEKYYLQQRHKLENTLAFHKVTQSISYRRINTNTEQLIALLRTQHVGALILPRGHPFRDDAWLRTQLLHANIPIIWVS